MKCESCGKEVEELEQGLCQECAEEKNDNNEVAIPSVEPEKKMETDKNEKQNESEKSGCLQTLMGIVFVLAVIFLGVKWYQKTSSEQNFYKKVYQYAEDSLREDLSGAYNVDMEGYSKDRISEQLYEYHDFGAGNLRYAVFVVNIPVEYDVAAGHMEIAPNIIVYYYTSNQNVSDGVDSTVQDHFYVEGMVDQIQSGFDDVFQ